MFQMLNLEDRNKKLGQSYFSSVQMPSTFSLERIFKAEILEATSVLW